jgi:hypothetical protein
MCLALAACQSRGAEPAPEPPATIEVRDGKGVIIAQLRPGHPCRATIGPIELLIGGSPLVAQDGNTRWSGEKLANGTTISRDGTPVARVQDQGAHVAVFDPAGLPIVKIDDVSGGATVADQASRVIRRVTQGKDGKLAVDAPALVATGTKDAKLVALLTASELTPELRMLAACERMP